MVEVLEEVASQLLLSWVHLAGTCHPGPIREPITEDLAAFRERGYVHGGAIASIVDAAMGAACSSVLGFERTKRIATLEIKLNYIKPAKVAPKAVIVATARVINESTSIIMSEATATDGEGRHIAKALGTYAILGAEVLAK